MLSAEQELPNAAMKFSQDIQSNQLFQQQRDIHHVSIFDYYCISAENIYKTYTSKQRVKLSTCMVLYFVANV